MPFVTSETTKAESADIGDYNGFVQARAAANTNLAGFSGQFTALVSTATVDARDNTTTGEGVPIHWMGGAQVAGAATADPLRRWTGTRWPARTEGGDSYTAWSGRGQPAGEKSGLRYAGADEVRMGDLGDVTLAASSPTAKAASEAHPLYALSAVITVAQPE